MPNWVATKLTISGEEAQLLKLRDQMSQPYQDHSWDLSTETFAHRQVEGAFLLWNIVKPTNLDAYYQVEETLEKAKARKEQPKPSLSPEEVMAKLQEAVDNFDPNEFIEFAQEFKKDIEVGQDWYHWNIREWGTKWEINNAQLTQTPGQLVYEFATAWSPIVEAADKLSAQYPKLVMTMRFLDEGHNFAGEIHWRGGKRSFEADIEINHGLLEEMYGECYACDNHADDPEHQEYRAEMKCDQFKQEIDIDSLL